ncbi:MAG: hypothetical protein KGN84_06315, partial [Acidobacteriota bacterium]|nr:hypothetical protein [Acidobacteriota bacterium]
PNPPVVFLNGYQFGCSGSDFASNFGAADKLLAANSIVSLYFDNCSFTNGLAKPTIEALGAAFGQFLAGLKYMDGRPVTQVDAVVHSMGGLILRSYLAGKQDVTPASFLPPATPAIRRAVFLSTPHFGSQIAALLGVDVQTMEMAPGSEFLFDLNRWNQGTDDLRGIEAISVAGAGGSGLESSVKGLDDGVVTVTSSSLGFYKQGVTRLVPDCHTADLLITTFGYCPTSAPPINQITNDMSNPVSQILVSFLTGTTAWKSAGTAAEANPLLAIFGGIELQLHDQNDAPVSISGATISNGSGGTTKLQVNANRAAYAELLPAGSSIDFSVTPATSGTVQTAAETLPATTQIAAIVKPGPTIYPKGVIPAAGPAPFPLDVAPGEYVSIYGSHLAASTAMAMQPYPTQLSDTQVLVNGVAQQVVYVSAGQINFVYSSANAGLTQLTVKNAGGQQTVNVRVAAAVPSIFLLDSNSTAAAVNALTGTVVSTQAPLHAGDFMSLFLTGLGATTHMNGLDYAVEQPAVSVGGEACAVTYAGRAPSYEGLDQINCSIPPGISGEQTPVVVSAGGRTSGTAFIAVQ